MRDQTKRHPGPPGWELGVASATLPHKKLRCYKNAKMHIARSGLRGRSKVLKINTVTDTPIMLEGGALDEVDSLPYLGSIVDNIGGGGRGGGGEKLMKELALARREQLSNS